MPRSRVLQTVDDVKARLHNLMIEDYGISQDLLDDQSPLAALAADSVGALSVTMGVEDEFDIEIPEADLSQLTTIEDAAIYIAHRLGLTDTGLPVGKRSDTELGVSPIAGIKLDKT